MTQPNDPNFAAPNTDDANGDEGGLNTGMPKVSAAPGKIFIVIGAFAAFVLFVVWLLRDGDKTPPAQTVKTEQVKISDVSTAPPPPPPPPEPVLPPPRLEPAPLEPPPMPDSPIIGNDNGPDNEAKAARLRSEMLVISNAGSGSDDNRSDASAGGDPNLGFAARAYRNTKADKAKAGSIGNLNLTIAQGKLIHAVLESAINTQLPGQVRAIVSRDIYAESGKNILVPKGSRLIGTYNTSVLQGQDRVFMIWTRIIRPDGIDIFVNSPGVDSLGRPGVEGYLDNRYQQIFTGAILTSVLSIGVAYASEQWLGAGETTSTTNTDGSSTNTSSPTSTAAIEATTNISDVGKRIVDKILDTRPLITIDQGTKINVMLNRDLIFPSDAAIGSAKMVP